MYPMAHLARLQDDNQFTDQFPSIHFSNLKLSSEVSSVHSALLPKLLGSATVQY